jgi:hypothetical protein
MIAYKTYEDCLEKDRPPGVLLSFPYMMRQCGEEETEDLQGQGYTVVTQEEYDTLVSSLSSVNEASMQIASIKTGILSPAISFGQELIITFAAENIGMGITQAGMTTTVRTVTADIVNALTTGSLYDAITAAKAVPEESYDPTFVTAARLLTFVNRIEDYLAIPRSTSL